MRRAELGVGVVDNRDGTWSFVLPEDLVFEEVEDDGIHLWSYQGQERFPWVPEPLEGEWIDPLADEGAPGFEDDPEGALGVGSQIRVDALGRRWLLIATDVELVVEIDRGYVESMWEMQASGEVLRSGLFDYSDEPTVIPEDGLVWAEPMGWDVTTCDGEDVVWDVETAPAVDAPAPLSSSQRKVLMLTSLEGTGSCSGTMVSENFLLTAAHCVTTGSGAAVTSGIWCTLENLDENIAYGYTPQCFSTSNVTPAPGWTGPTSYTLDYALVELNGTPNVGWMDLNVLTDADTAEKAHYLHGYARRRQDCSETKVIWNPLTTVDAYNGKHLRTSAGEVDSYTMTFMRYNTSTAKGMSGGPHFYCTTACTEHIITGVNAYYDMNSCSGTPKHCVTGDAIGPKITAIRAWILSNI